MMTSTPQITEATPNAATRTPSKSRDDEPPSLEAVSTPSSVKEIEVPAASVSDAADAADATPTPTGADSSKSEEEEEEEGGSGEEEYDELDHQEPRRIRTPLGPELVGLSKIPFQLIQVPLPWQHAVSRNESKLLSAEQKSMMVQRPVRVMLCAHPVCGPDAHGRLHLTPSHVWFVAKDIAQLLHIHEANVARRIAPFLPHERARMPVQCMQSNGTKATLMLSVLSVDGMTRLLTASKKAVMGVRLHRFLTTYVTQLCLATPTMESVLQSVTPSPSPSASTLSLHPSALTGVDANHVDTTALASQAYQANPSPLIPLPRPAGATAAKGRPHGSSFASSRSYPMPASPPRSDGATDGASRPKHHHGSSGGSSHQESSSRRSHEWSSKREASVDSADLATTAAKKQFLPTHLTTAQPPPQPTPFTHLQPPQPPQPTHLFPRFLSPLAHDPSQPHPAMFAPPPTMMAPIDFSAHGMPQPQMFPTFADPSHPLAQQEYATHPAMWQHQQQFAPMPPQSGHPMMPQQAYPSPFYMPAAPPAPPQQMGGPLSTPFGAPFMQPMSMPMRMPLPTMPPMTMPMTQSLAFPSTQPMHACGPMCPCPFGQQHHQQQQFMVGGAPSQMFMSTTTMPSTNAALASSLPASTITTTLTTTMTATSLSDASTAQATPASTSSSSPSISAGSDLAKSTSLLRGNSAGTRSTVVASAFGAYSPPGTASAATRSNESSPTMPTKTVSSIATTPTTTVVGLKQQPT